MKKTFDIIVLCLKLVLELAMIVGLVFLLKIGVEFLADINDFQLPWKSSSSVEVDYPLADLTVTFDEIYNTYKRNELLADDLYGGNRYRITAIVKDIESDGIFNLTGGATLNLRVEVGDALAVLLAEFEEDQEDALKKIAIGDTVVFEGTCVSAGAWTDCMIVE
jgi:hypothetical protein